MSKVSGALRRLERQWERQRERRGPGRVLFVTSWDDPDYVTDEDGRRWPAAEWERLHPDAVTIQMTWGDEGYENE